MPDHFIEDLGGGVYAIDTDFQRPRFDAAYLVIENDRAAFVDTGTNHAVPRLLAALAALGLAPDSVDWVIPTHVHLDHAGGVGLLMQQLPRAQLLVHPRGLRHMVDPRVLWAGARAVYGDEEMERSYGRLVPVPPERAVASHDGMVVALGGTRPLHLLDTPGHARHHHCVWDARTRGWFTGDTFGLSYREFDTAQGAWILPTSTPVQFEPEALRASIGRMMAFEPTCMYLTHYSKVGDVPRLAALLLDEIDEMVAVARPLATTEQRHEKLQDGLRRMYLRRVREHGCTMPDEQVEELLALDVELNAQGLAIWLDRAARAAAINASSASAPPAS